MWVELCVLECLVDIGDYHNFVFAVRSLRPHFKRLRSSPGAETDLASLRLHLEPGCVHDRVLLRPHCVASG